MAPEFIDATEVAKRLGVSASFLNKARLTGSGPPYVKFGAAVRYNWAGVLEWTSKKTQRSTSESREVA
jgi:predicted DNA-binding transcriptional regulator AlpA